MRLDREALKRFVIGSAAKRFGAASFSRHELIDVVEADLRRQGHWDVTDDAPSKSTDPKSLGRASIDVAISDLKQESTLQNPSRNVWRVPARFWPAGADRTSANGVPNRDTIAGRLRRLADATARIGGDPLPLEAGTRDRLYEGA